MGGRRTRRLFQRIQDPTMSISSTPSYGYLSFLQHPEARELRIQAAGHAEEGLALFTIPENDVGTTGVNVTVNGELFATFHHLAVDRSAVAFVYRPGAGSYREFRLGPCHVRMDR